MTLQRKGIIFSLASACIEAARDDNELHAGVESYQNHFLLEVNVREKCEVTTSYEVHLYLLRRSERKEPTFLAHFGTFEGFDKSTG